MTDDMLALVRRTMHTPHAILLLRVSPDECVVNIQYGNSGGPLLAEAPQLAQALRLGRERCAVLNPLDPAVTPEAISELGALAAQTKSLGATLRCSLSSDSARWEASVTFGATDGYRSVRTQASSLADMLAGLREQLPELSLDDAASSL